MTDKKTFGGFIKQKRIEKNYSQKDLAEILFVTEGAVSKWERGVSYPDITLISGICNALDISEHELITASTDTDERQIKHEAKKFRVIRSTWIMVPTISYIVALVTCFICNLAVNHTLSWFFIVLSSLICAYTFVPNLTYLFKEKKLFWFTVTTYFSICLLLFTCATYTKTFFWFPVACIGIMMGYVMIFLPILLSTRYKFVISFTVTCALTVLLLFVINARQPFMLKPAILVTLYSYLPAILCTIICTLKFDAFLKTGVCIYLSTTFYYFLRHIVNLLFGVNENHYEVDFHNWEKCISQNVSFIVLTSLIFIGTVFIVIGIIRKARR